MYLQLKQAACILLLFVSLAASAQKNVFLDQAFWKNNPDVATIQAAIDAGNDPAQANASGFDGVTNAINGKASTAAIKLMLAQKGNDVNKITHDARTYIFWAASRGNVEIVEYLLANGASLDVLDSRGMTAIAFAAANGQTDPKIYDAFIKAGANLKAVNDEGANLLLQGIANDKDLLLTDYLVSKGLSLQSKDAAGSTAFDYAAKTGNKVLLEKLRSKGVQPTQNAMIMASQGTRGSNNTLEVYQYLEGLKIKPTATNNHGENALHFLARKPNQLEIINYFIEKGVNVNQADRDGNTPFMNAAAANRDLATVQLLLSKVTNINQVNKKGVSALAMAVRGNSSEVTQLLLAKGATTNGVDADGNNLAWYLVQSYGPRTAADFEAKLALLQEHKVALTNPQQNGNSLYHLAVVKNDLNLLKLLAKLQLDVNQKNKEGLTALHKAAMVSKDDVILKYLLSIGAKKELTTEFEETALDLAKENEYLSKNNVPTDFLK